MHRWTIGRRLLVSFSAIAILVVLLGGVNYYGLRSSSEQLQRLVKADVAALERIITVRDAIRQIETAQQSLLNSTLTAERRAEEIERIKVARDVYIPALEAFQKESELDDAGRARASKLSDVIAIWRKANDEFFALSRQLDELNLPNPAQLQADLAGFHADHADLVADILAGLQSRQLPQKEGDADACRLGRWLETFTTTNPALRAVADAIREPHQRFHAAVARARELVNSGDVTAASTHFSSVALPAGQDVLKHLSEGVAVTQNAIAIWNQIEQHNREKVAPARTASINLLTEIADGTVKSTNMQADQSARASSRLVTVSLIIGCAGLAIAAGLGILTTRSIRRILERITESLSTGAHQINDAATQVAFAAQQLAGSAGEQASSLEETSSALEQMSAMTRANAAHSKEANELSSHARDAAHEGDRTMARLNEAMQAINTSSEKISRIIKVIEEIAFQTNLLALNAAVEAARAGEHGKGFAVVADEVRTLAQRAAQAARETTELIQESVESAHCGAAVAAEVAQTLSAIVTDVGSVSTLIDGISKASEEQAQGVEQINSAVNQMDKVTQQNAAGAEESAAAAEELSAQAEALKGIVDELVSLVGLRVTSEPKPLRTGAPSTDPSACKTSAPTAVQSPTRTQDPVLSSF